MLLGILNVIYMISYKKIELINTILFHLYIINKMLGLSVADFGFNPFTGKFKDENLQVKTQEKLG